MCLASRLLSLPGPLAYRRGAACASANADRFAPGNYELRRHMGRSLTIGDPAAERIWPVVHMRAGLDPLPYLKTLARDDEVAFPFDRKGLSI